MRRAPVRPTRWSLRRCCTTSATWSVSKTPQWQWPTTWTRTTTWSVRAGPEPVRLHVAAKRYLVTAEPTYAARLSPASVHTLRLQGGPMSASECAAFRQLPHAEDALRLRCWDDLAKDAAAPPLTVDAFLAALGDALRPSCR